MGFTLLNAPSQSSAMSVHMLAAGDQGDTYFLRCRDRDMGNLRDVPAHMLSDLVDEEGGEAIDTDDLLNDLAQVAYEVIEAATDDTPQNEATPTQSAPA
tara:strand:- start:336 stop:632 length:297 start_codon:yes stop_codon:yes gene_type:complete